MGSLAGQFLPLQINSFAFALSALFAILLTEQIRAHRSVLPLVAGTLAVLVIVPLKLDFGVGMFVSGLAAILIILGWHTIAPKPTRTEKP